MKNKTKKIILFICIFAIIILLNNYTQASSGLKLENLNYDVVLNEDGSANIEETWNISIQDTNTLFKTFKVDKSKYKEIKDVTVQEVKSTGTVNFNKINEYQYHVYKNCYYGLMHAGKFEIAWGAHAKNTTRTYKISYKVVDAIKNYKDCSEFYWQFISTESEIPARKVEGTIKLSTPVTNMEDLRVWAHGPLNGNITKISNDTVKFDITQLPSNTMLEARIVTPTSTFRTNKNVSDVVQLNDILKQEQKWADKANMQRQQIEQRKRNMMIGLIILNIIGLVIAIYIIKKIKKYKNELKDFPKIVPEQEMEYFRDIPNDDATPAEAGFLYYFKSLGLQANISKVISATMLNLCLKKYIEFEVLR